MKTYNLVYQFRYDIAIEAESPEEAVAIAQEIDWDEWEETWTGPYIEFEVDNMLAQMLSLCHKEGEGDE